MRIATKLNIKNIEMYTTAISNLKDVRKDRRKVGYVESIDPETMIMEVIITDKEVMELITKGGIKLSAFSIGEIQEERMNCPAYKSRGEDERR